MNDDSYKTIDGNYAKAVRAYCTRYRGYLTDKQMRTHRCQTRHGGMCGRLQDMKGGYIRKMKTEQYYDKAIDRLTKIETALNRIGKALERFGILMDELEERFNQMEDEQVEENE